MTFKTFLLKTFTSIAMWIFFIVLGTIIPLLIYGDISSMTFSILLLSIIGFAGGSNKVADAIDPVDYTSFKSFLKDTFYSRTVWLFIIGYPIITILLAEKILDEGTYTAVVEGLIPIVLGIAHIGDAMQIRNQKSAVGVLIDQQGAGK